MSVPMTSTIANEPDVANHLSLNDVCNVFGLSNPMQTPLLTKSGKGEIKNPGESDK